MNTAAAAAHYPAVDTVREGCEVEHHTRPVTADGYTPDPAGYTPDPAGYSPGPAECTRSVGMPVLAPVRHIVGSD